MSCFALQILFVCLSLPFLSAWVKSPTHLKPNSGPQTSPQAVSPIHPDKPSSRLQKPSETPPSDLPSRESKHPSVSLRSRSSRSPGSLPRGRRAVPEDVPGERRPGRSEGCEASLFEWSSVLFEFGHCLAVFKLIFCLFFFSIVRCRMGWLGFWLDMGHGLRVWNMFGLQICASSLFRWVYCRSEV